MNFADEIRQRQDSLRASLMENGAIPQAPDKPSVNPATGSPWTRQEIRDQGYTDVRAASDDVRARGDHRDDILLGRLAKLPVPAELQPAS